MTYLSPGAQYEVAHKLAGLLPWNSYTRKIIGYLHAISQGARIIYESDDDNNDAELVLDAVTGFKYDHLYRRTYALGCFNISAPLATPSEQMEPFGRVRRLLARKLSERKPLEQMRYIQQVGVDFDPRILSLCLQPGTTYFDAFGQS